MTPRRLTALLALLASTAVPAQDHHHGEHHSPYADEERSAIAALSPTELQGLEAGAGLGLAKAAELNRYPGPKHVLELAEALDLTPEQRERVTAIHAEMLAEAQRLGTAIVAAEATLDRRFQHRHIDEASLAELVAEIARLRGELRFTHLVAHLATAPVLDEEQTATYQRLRGYDGTTISDGT